MRGSVVLPTGAGKSLIVLQAIHLVNRSALVVCPTIDLLHQWYRILSHAFSTEIGVYYGNEKKMLPLTVTTFHFLENVGELNAFKLIIADEAHHSTSQAFGERLMMTPAPYRLGLTATYP